MMAEVTDRPVRTVPRHIPRAVRRLASSVCRAAAQFAVAVTRDAHDLPIRKRKGCMSARHFGGSGQGWRPADGVTARALESRIS